MVTTTIGPYSWEKRQKGRREGHSSHVFVGGGVVSLSPSTQSEEEEEEENSFQKGEGEREEAPPTDTFHG